MAGWHWQDSMGELMVKLDSAGESTTATSRMVSLLRIMSFVSIFALCVKTNSTSQDRGKQRDVLLGTASMKGAAGSEPGPVNPGWRSLGCTGAIAGGTANVL